MSGGHVGLALGALVFGAGIGSLATEIAASRLLAPYFGSSTIVWANLIGLVLASLAIGYWLGGRIADRRPEPRLLGLIVVASGVYVAAVTFVAKPLLDLTIEGLDETSAGGGRLLLRRPAPLRPRRRAARHRVAVRDPARAPRRRERGRDGRRFYALSTAGSLVGTFVPALVLIPLIGTQRTLLLTAAVLAASGSLLLGRRSLASPWRSSVLLLIPPGALKASPGLVHEETSLYQYVQVVEKPDGRRQLFLNEGVAVHSLWYPDSVLTGGIWDTFLALPPLLDRPLERVAILGNAAGYDGAGAGRLLPRRRIDGVELDPRSRRPAAVVRHGRDRRADGARRRRAAVPAPDGRALRPDRRRRLPPAVRALLPRDAEFFRLARERLRPGGIVALNVAAVPGDGASCGRRGTLAAELPQVVLVAGAPLQHRGDRPRPARPPEELRRRLGTGPADLAPLRELLLGGAAPGRAVRRPVDGRPRAGRVGDRPDDRRVRGRGRRPRRGLPADAAGR